MKDHEGSLEQKIEKAVKTFSGITEALNAVSLSPILKLPSDLQSKKKGMLVCLAVGTVGIVGVVAFKGPWYAYLTLAILVLTVTILVGRKGK